MRIKSEALLLGVPVCIGSLVAPRWVFVAVVVHVRQLGYVLRRRASRGCSKVVLVCALNSDERLWVGALWVVVVATVVDCECTGAGLTKFDLVSRGWCPSGMKGAFAVTGLSDWVWVGCLV